MVQSTRMDVSIFDCSCACPLSLEITRGGKFSTVVQDGWSLIINNWKIFFGRACFKGYLKDALSMSYRWAQGKWKFSISDFRNSSLNGAEDMAIVLNLVDAAEHQSMGW